jgi:hypothetical protein
MKMKTAVNIFYWMSAASAAVHTAVFVGAQYLKDNEAMKGSLVNLTLSLVVMGLCLLAEPQSKN